MTDQTQPIYKAERIWRGSTPSAGRSISPQAAYDLTGEIIHHPNANSIEGIQNVREAFTPEKFKLHTPGTEFELPQGLHAATTSEGHIIVRPERLTPGIITHEASHLVTRLSSQFDEHLPQHDAAFARQHVETAHAVLGRPAGRRLSLAYDQHGVELGR